MISVMIERTPRQPQNARWPRKIKVPGIGLGTRILLPGIAIIGPFLERADGPTHASLCFTAVLP
jgi:hypothetical protein